MSETNNIQLNFNGFSTEAFFSNEKVSATSISVSSSENIVGTQAFFGGDINASGEYFRLGQQGMYELPDISGNLSIEPTFEQIQTLFLDILKNREKSKSLEINVADKKSFIFPYCYIQSMTMGTSENQLLTFDYSFYIKSKSLMSNITNDVLKLHSGRPVHIPFTPIAYWETTISGFNFSEQKVPITGWKLNFAQNVVPKYCLSYDIKGDEPSLPKAVWVEHPKMDLEVSFVLDKNSFSFDNFCSLFDEGKTNYEGENKNSVKNPQSVEPEEKVLSIAIRGQEIIQLQYGKIMSVTPTLNSGGAITVSVNFSINAINV